MQVESLLPLAFGGSLRGGPPSLQQAGDGDPSIVGTGVYLLASLLNHSCDPSLNVAFPRHDQQVKPTSLQA